MSCLGCYKEQVTDGYCLPCRKKLFDGARIASVFSFKAPGSRAGAHYREQTKRLSISGVQLKYSLALRDGALTLTENDGQYILKPVPPAISIAHAGQAPENEHLTMQIAAQVFKIETAANALIYFEGGQPAYLTRRFDVKTDGTRCLQEDFAQLGGKTAHTHGSHYKYTGTYEDAGLLIKKYVAASAPAMEVFLRNIVFNYLFSNGDAHLKNFSLIQAVTGDYKLTPAYDMMSTIIHVPGETDTALDLFDDDIHTPHYQVHGCYGYPDFMELASRLSIIEARAKRIMVYMTSHVDKVTGLIHRSFLSEEAKAQYLHYYLDKVRRIKIPS